MFEGMARIPTGETDKHGEMIYLGDTVKSESGFIGTVVFENGAFRVDTHDGFFLKYHSSLLYGDGEKKLFEIIKGGV